MNELQEQCSCRFFLFFLKNTLSCFEKVVLSVISNTVVPGRNNKQQEDKVQLFVYLLHAGG